MTTSPLGIDISKLKFDACLLREGGKLRHKVFPTHRPASHSSPPGLRSTGSSMSTPAASRPALTERRWLLTPTTRRRVSAKSGKHSRSYFDKSSINGTALGAGEGAAVSEETALRVSAASESEFLLFDLG